jgi:hypothetical protein
MAAAELAWENAAVQGYVFNLKRISDGAIGGLGPFANDEAADELDFT